MCERSVLTRGFLAGAKVLLALVFTYALLSLAPRTLETLAPAPLQVVAAAQADESVTACGADAGGVAAARVSAELDLGSLEVREGSGGVKPLSDGDRREIKKQIGNILGTGTASFTSSRIVKVGVSGGAVEGTLTINSTAQPARLQVTEAGSGRYRGTATVTQSAFGIKPYSGFFGTLKIKDEVGVEFEVDLSKAGAAPAS